MVKPIAADGGVEVPLEVQKRRVATEQKFHPPRVEDGLLPVVAPLVLSISFLRRKERGKRTYTALLCKDSAS